MALQSKPQKVAIRSSSYYFDEKFITLQVSAQKPIKAINFFCAPLTNFKVEDKLYKIPVDVIKKRSQVFADMLTIPTNDSKSSMVPGEGQCDGQPIYLHGHSSKDFDCLMEFFFDGCVHCAAIK
jgi:hypothetical protein